MSAWFWILTRLPIETPSSMNASRPTTHSAPIVAPDRTWARCQMLVPAPTLTSGSRSAVAWTRAEGSITGAEYSRGCGPGLMAVAPERRWTALAGPLRAHALASALACGAPGRLASLARARRTQLGRVQRDGDVTSACGGARGS